MKIKSVNLHTNEETEWEVPSMDTLVKHSQKTHGIQYDRVERAKVTGGLPYVLTPV